MRGDDWKLLINRLERGRCTPFLGAGASVPTLPTGGQIAREWAEELKYPLPDKQDLARVAQYWAYRQDPAAPKEGIQQALEGRGQPNFDDPAEPHAMLAELPIPLFITTNYDDFMVKALEARGKQPRAEICRWKRHESILAEPAPMAEDPAFKPDVMHPIVFHLHGRLDVLPSLVLTEDDYLDFLVALSEDRDTVLPHQVRGALSGTSLLFLGYALEDWNFRVLYRGLVARGDPALRRISVTVQLDTDKPLEVKEYLDLYFKDMRVSVFWGDIAAFAADLRNAWNDYAEVHQP